MEPSDSSGSLDWGSLRDPFTAVVFNGDTDFDSDLGVDAIAAAIVLASQLPGGEALKAWYGPDLPPADPAVDVPHDIPPLALRALDCLVGDDAAWREPWEAGGGLTSAADAVQAARAVLERATGGL